MCIINPCDVLFQNIHKMPFFNLSNYSYCQIINGRHIIRLPIKGRRILVGEEQLAAEEEVGKE